ncbi:O-antigen ligase family protein [Arthrobacter sp. CC3]|uniref:O-antigen ligase family protein n=1 Tax=Arthrobacter sp. CC3 TaxID=3029185 RepID=UPI0032679EE6
MTADNVVSACGAAILGTALMRRFPAVQLSGPLVLPIGIVALLSLSIAAHGADVLFNVARFAGVALLCVAVYLGTAEDRRSISIILNTIVMISSLIIVAQPITSWPAPWGNVEGEGLRYGGLFGHPNFAAYTLGLYALYQVIRLGPLAKRIVLIGPPVAALMLSGSRTAIIVFGIVMLIAVAVRPKTVWPFVAGSALVAVVVGATFLSRFEDFFQTGGFAGTANAGGWRFIQWQHALDLAPRPNIWGIGWGMSEKYLPQGLGVHNGFLQFYVETGIVGCLIFAIALVSAIASTARSLTASLLWVFAIVTTFFDPVLMYPSSIAVLVTILSVTYAKNLSRSPQSDSERLHFKPWLARI